LIVKCGSHNNIWLVFNENETILVCICMWKFCKICLFVQYYSLIILVFQFFHLLLWSFIINLSILLSFLQIYPLVFWISLSLSILDFLWGKKYVTIDAISLQCLQDKISSRFCIVHELVKKTVSVELVGWSTHLVILRTLLFWKKIVSLSWMTCPFFKLKNWSIFTGDQLFLKLKNSLQATYPYSNFKKNFNKPPYFPEIGLFSWATCYYEFKNLSIFTGDLFFFKFQNFFLASFHTSLKLIYFHGWPSFLKFQKRISVSLYASLKVLLFSWAICLFWN